MLAVDISHALDSSFVPSTLYGLNPNEEIEARRIKTNILEGDEEIFKKRIIDLFNIYNIKMDGGFYKYILNNDKVLYSVFERIGGIKQMYYYLDKYNLL